MWEPQHLQPLTEDPRMSQDLEDASLGLPEVIGPCCRAESSSGHVTPGCRDPKGQRDPLKLVTGPRAPCAAITFVGGGCEGGTDAQPSL